MIGGNFYLLFGEIDLEKVEPIIEWVLQSQFENESDITLVICSEGGDISAAFALIDVMIRSKIPVKTVGLGEIASAGLMIFMAGHERIITQNTMILSHQFSGGSDSINYHDLKIKTVEYDLLFEKMVDYYHERTNLSKSQIIKKLLPKQDVWLSPNEALKYNICHKIE